ncbi:MAG: CheR family methyltransferase, partial [Pyrinomonadaceae bacterium]
IERRINVHTLTGLPAYARFMREHSEEAQALLKDLLISVTNFFRDAEAFRSLQWNIIPRLFAGKGSGDYVRVWVAGCATGEEAYSIAMLLAEYSANIANAPSVQLFATDIDEPAVSAARAGFYSDTDIADVSPERLRQFFVKEKGGYRVRRELREMVLFAVHNLIRDPPFSHLDMVSCRNLLIYLNRTAQERAMEVFHFALNPGGYLFLGSAESAEGAGDLFLAVEKDAHLYQSRVASRAPLPLPDVIAASQFDRRPKEEGQQEESAYQRPSTSICTSA